MMGERSEDLVARENIFPFPVSLINGKVLGICSFLANDRLEVVKWQLFMFLKLDERGVRNYKDLAVLINNVFFTDCHRIADSDSSNDNHITVVLLCATD